MAATFEILIPRSVVGASGKKARVVQYGHGLFGDKSEAQVEYLQEDADRCMGVRGLPPLYSMLIALSLYIYIDIYIYTAQYVQNATDRSIDAILFIAISLDVAYTSVRRISGYLSSHPCRAQRNPFRFDLRLVPSSVLSNRDGYQARTRGFCVRRM